MSFGVQIWDGSGNLVYDSSVAVGGIIADVRVFPAGSAGAVLTYPVYLGRAVEIIPLTADSSSSSYGVVADTDLGYPRVTVSSFGGDRRFAVEVY